MSDLDIGRLKQICLNHLDGQGFHLRQRWDFAEVERELPAMGKERVSPTLSVQQSDLTEGNAFWLTMEQSGVLVGAMAMRMDDLGRQSIGQFLKAAYARQYSDVELVEVSGHVPQVVRDVRGKVVYMGDLFFSKAIRGSRANLMCFVHLSHAICFDKWKHDWTYAFHRREDVLNGYADRYGFNNRWPGGQVWKNPPSYRANAEYLSVISREEFEQKAAYYSLNSSLLTA